MGHTIGLGLGCGILRIGFWASIIDSQGTSFHVKDYQQRMSMEFILSVTLYPWFFIYQIIKLSIKQLESIQPWNNDILRVLDRLYRPLWVTLYIIFYKEEANIVYA